MSIKDNGSYAFPVKHGCGADKGMSLRDYFAAKAVQAMLSSPNCPKLVDEKELARQAYETADAMLEVRK